MVPSSSAAANQGDQEIKSFYYHVTGQEVKTNDLSQFVPDKVFLIGGNVEYFMLLVMLPVYDIRLLLDSYMYLDFLLASSVMIFQHILC